MKPDQIDQAKGAVISTAFGLCAETEAKLLERLEALYWQGFKAGAGAGREAGEEAGREQMRDIVCSMSRDIAEMVFARINGNDEAVFGVLDTLIKTNVQIIGGIAASPQTH